VFCLERAVAAVDKLPPTPEVLALAVDVRFEVRNALWAVGELSRGLEYLRDATPLVEALGDRRRQARLFARMSFNALILGDNDGTLEAGERALALAKEVDDAAVRVEAHQYLGLLHHSLGNYDRAIHHLESNLRALADVRRHARFTDYYAVHSRSWLVWSLCELGDLARATGLAREAATIAEESNQSYNVVAARWAQGLLYLTNGQPALAIPELQHALSVCKAADVSIWLRPSQALLGRALAVADRLPEGLPLLEQAMHPDENHVAVTGWETYLAEAHMLAGRLEEAAAHAQHAADVARERREHGSLAHAHHQLAQITERRGSVGEAREHYEHALRLARDRGMRPLIADCERGLARLLPPAERTSGP
jgi:tetratricopeptide (TPR) repeat protein